MIFKNIEIYLLYASSTFRWGVTFGLLLAIFSSWWYFAFAPLCSKLKLSKRRFESVCVLNQEADQKNRINSLHFKAITQKIAFAPDHNYFLKDLLKHGLETRAVSV